MKEPKRFRRNLRKNEPPERFQPKVLIIWLIIFAAIIGLWSMYPAQGNAPKTWSISRVVAATEQGLVASGTMENDQTGGVNWYVIRGVVEKEAQDSAVGTRGADSPTGLRQGKIFFKAEGRLTDKDFAILQDSGVYIEQRASSLLRDFLLSLFPFLIVIGLLYFLFVRQLRAAGRGAMSFGKSKARMLTQDRDKVTFKDVAGCDEAKEEVQEIVEFLKDPKKFQKIGGQVPKGALMVGPPGTGKTLLAKAVAGEADVPFFTISGSDFVEMFVGVGAARVRDMFEQGRKNAPCLIFIDEIDAVGRQRGAGLGGGNDEREQTLNSMLVEMDGFDGRDGVIIIAATNRPDVLDGALLRPGRFDRQIIIDLPDLVGREQVLKIHAKKIKMEEAIDLKLVARNTPGFSGADLANLLNESALIAARYDKEKVAMVDIEEAREKISYGRERRKLMDDEDKKITAYHEAGHALVQAVIDDGHLPIHKVTIIPRGRSLGSTMFSPKKDILNHTKKHILNQICCAMGGRIAEELTFGDITSGASGDISMATKMARHMVCDWGMSNDLGLVALGENQDHIFLGKEITRTQNYSEKTAQHIDRAIREIIDTQYARAHKILEEKNDVLKGIAEALIEYETIDGKHVHELLDYGEIRSDIIKQPSRLSGTADDKDEVDKEGKGVEEEAVADDAADSKEKAVADSKQRAVPVKRQKDLPQKKASDEAVRANTSTTKK